MAEQAILYDSSLCTACKGCQVACKCWNNLPSPTDPEVNGKAFTGTYQNPPELNADTRLIMTFDEREGGSKGIMWAFGRRACQHCSDAPCADICPEDAIHKDEETGMVTLDQDLCVGCQYCSIACPYGVPHYSDAKDGLKTVVNKCTGCVDRIEQGLAPACVSTCQPDALKFGPRDEMLALAHERVEILKARGFDKACVYGENEMGGLHVIQVLKYGVEAHGQVADPKVNPLVDVIKLMKPITGVVSGVVVLGLGAMAVLASGYKRDERVYNPDTKDTISLDTGEVLKHGDGFDEEPTMEHIKGAVGGLVGQLTGKSKKSDAESSDASNASKGGSDE